MHLDPTQFGKSERAKLLQLKIQPLQIGNRPSDPSKHNWLVRDWTGMITANLRLGPAFIFRTVISMIVDEMRHILLPPFLIAIMTGGALGLPQPSRAAEKSSPGEKLYLMGVENSNSR